MYIFPDAMLKELVLAIENDTTLFPASWKLHLYTNNLIPTRNNVVGDFTELTNVEVPGYVVTAPTWNGTPVRNPSGSWEDRGSVSLFAATGTVPSPQIVYGWYATNSAGSVLIGAGALATPFTYTKNGDGFRLVADLVVNQIDQENTNVFLDMLQLG